MFLQQKKVRAIYHTKRLSERHKEVCNVSSCDLICSRSSQGFINVVDCLKVFIVMFV